MSLAAQRNTLDIVGIGNAIVDVLAQVEPAFIERWNMQPGTMALIDAARAASISESLEAETPGGLEMIGGGSVANSCVVAAMLGARVAYLGRVDNDQFGAAFVADLATSGIAFPVAPLADEPNSGAPTSGAPTSGAPTSGERGTGRCVIAVTPDGQRTMNTYLGAATSFGPADLDRDTIERGHFLYLEGYLFDPPAAQSAFREAAAMAHAAGRQVAISLSDPFCVERHRAGFRAFVRDHADIVFANEHELEALYEAPFADALAALRGDVAIAVVTRGPAGSVLARGTELHHVAAHATEVVDTTGAGDAYAAGVLTALARGRGLAEAGRLGSLAAAEIISHVGARPGPELLALARAAGLA